MTITSRADNRSRTQVASDDFVSEETLTRWQHALDQRGLRATGSPEHEDYIADLARRLHAAGAAEVYLEPVSMRRWVPTRCELTHLTATGIEQPVTVLSYVAYSGATPAAGVTAPLSTTPAAGTIGLVDIPLVGMKARDFDALDWDAPAHPAHGSNWDPEAPFERVWLSQDLMREALAEHQAAGAAGLVLIIDTDEHLLNDAYLLYDGIHRSLPAVFVGRETGARLRASLGSTDALRLTLEAHVEATVTHNLVALVPGASPELVVLHSHTDGTNGLEDNGPEAIVAMVDYLAALPAGDLPRGVLVLLSTGHFAIEEAWGVEAFLDRHATDLVPRIAAALTLEHLGALSRPEDYPKGFNVPKHEFGACFATPHRAVIDAVRDALINAEVTDPIVLRPFVPDKAGNSPDGTSWPGDGCPFWHTAGLPAANFITGPGYTFNAEPVVQYIDVAALRRQAIAFTQATLELAALPWNQLREAAHPPIDIASTHNPASAATPTADTAIAAADPTLDTSAGSNR